MNPSRIALDPPVRAEIVSLLNQQVALLTDLWHQTKLAHWNVRGPHFQAYHVLCDTIAADVATALDDVAERAVTLGGVAGMSLPTVAATSGLPAWDLTERRDQVVLRFLADRLGAAANRVRRAIDDATQLGDAATADLFTELARQLDKDLWLVEAHEA